ncbi:hypothetical protein [Desulfofustis limnaeus]|uniref:Uncharacterized protein n=1 Tax=Desulfofustis limnaeus TaxID=2740163 RepID=A0ABM7WCP9_9BACT|nr:hypothetical protein [Desulfofustis limnaeus]BDD88691.1 hypothetical protein DPPLL_30560 [Desulfofustis limnaeus]
MKANEALRRLFSAPGPASWPGTVRRKTGAGRYLVQDVFGGVHEVAADGFWRPGQGVTVAGGRIVDGSALVGTIKTIEV